MEIIANALQTVQANQNVYFSDTVVSGGTAISHRDDSGLITLRGNTGQCRARFRVTFGGNIAIPTGGTVEDISMAIVVEGEPLSSTIMTVTPAAVENFWNIFTAVLIDVPQNCCISIGVRNINDQAIEVQNANLIVERVA